MLKRIFRINHITGEKANDEARISRPGKIDPVYSTFSLRHWDIPAQAPQTTEAHGSKG